MHTVNTQHEDFHTDDLPDHEHDPPALVLDTMRQDRTRASRVHLPAETLSEALVERYADPCRGGRELQLHLVRFERWPAEARAAFYWLCVLLRDAYNPWAVVTGDGRFEDPVEAVRSTYRPGSREDEPLSLEEPC